MCIGGGAWTHGPFDWDVMLKRYRMMAAGSVLLLTAGVAMADEPADISAVLEDYSVALAVEDVNEAEAWVLADADEFTIFEGSGKDVGWIHNLEPTRPH